MGNRVGMYGVGGAALGIAATTFGAPALPAIAVGAATGALIGLMDRVDDVAQSTKQGAGELKTELVDTLKTTLDKTGEETSYLIRQAASEGKTIVRLFSFLVVGCFTVKLASVIHSYRSGEFCRDNPDVVTCRHADASIYLIGTALTVAALMATSKTYFSVFREENGRSSAPQIGDKLTHLAKTDPQKSPIKLICK
jgi:hypothetical protein